MPRNYILKNKLGVIYTDQSKKILDKEINDRKQKEEMLVNELNDIKKKLENKTLTFKVKSGKNGKIFGNISTKQISDEIKKLNYNIDKKNIILDYNIDTLGSHIVLIDLHKKVKFNIKIEVISG